MSAETLTKSCDPTPVREMSDCIKKGSAVRGKGRCNGNSQAATLVGMGVRVFEYSPSSPKYSSN